MQNTIMNPVKGMIVDHIDHNGLNNQRSNLRVCTISENNQNRRPKKGKNYLGTKFVKSTNKWHAILRTKFIGTFLSEIEAAKAYDKAAKEKFGEFAYLNFPNE